MPRDPNRERVRARQACRNCRKKKARCPSEKPACSTCTRLKQVCNYDGPRPPDRLADLEYKVDLILNRSSRYPPGDIGEDLDIGWQNEDFEMPARSEPNATVESSSMPSFSGLNVIIPNTDPGEGSRQIDYPQDASRPTLPESVILESLEIYFQRFHRQPIWCFNREDLGSPTENCKELLCSIIELTSRFMRDQRSPDYGETAKLSILLRISKGDVDIEIIESLCLLSYSAFIDENNQLGQFYLGLGFQLYQQAKLDQISTSQNPKHITEREKRSLWSLQSLEQFYGEQNGILTRSPEVWRPYYVSNYENTLFPRKSMEASTPSDIGIWAFSVHFGWAWSRVREYISECSQNKLIEPWRLDSTYAKVLADMTEIENKVPLCHRYDKLKFYQRRPNEVQLHQNYWMPWLKLQFTWHAILTTINHPFLYIAASRRHPSLAIPNTFWRRSSELVLLHATWIVRLIDMTYEKDIKLLDPFFAHAAAIAATVHIYFSCAPDPRLKQKSKSDLKKCQKFLESFSTISHACESFAHILNKLSEIAFGRWNFDDNLAPSTIRISVPLMWAILQPGSSRSKTVSSPIGTLVPGFTAHDSQEIDQNPTLEISDTETPPTITIDPSVGYDATLPPYKASSTTVEYTHDDSIRETVVPPSESFFLNTPWLWADSSEFVSTDTQLGLPTEPIAGGSEGFSTWWDFGNL